MKRIFVLALVLLMAFAGTVSATKSKFKDPSFNSKTVVRFNLAEANHIGREKEYHSAEARDAVQRVVNALKSAMAKHQKTLLESQDTSIPAKYNLYLTVNGLGSYQKWHEPWDETVTENKKVVGKDKNGKDVIVTVPVKRIVHHPGYYYTVSYAEIELTVKDRDTGKTVYNCIDERSREGDYTGMVKRICADFANDLK